MIEGDEIRTVAELPVLKRSAESSPLKKMIPERLRSAEVVGKDGRKHRVGTIRDVVAWSLTEWGARQASMFPGFQYDHGLSCSASRGWCE
jgi:hypothetical protein